MADKLDARPTAETYTLERLIQLVRDGQVRVPHFQRNFRWGREDVRRLFDSILRGYPIGSLLLWQRRAPAREITLGVLKIDAPERDNSLWVVDGQQRIISLASALDPAGQHDERFALSYDVLAGTFVTTPSTEKSTVVPLPVLFDLPQVLKWFTRYPEVADYVDHVNSVTSALRQYPIPANQVDQEDPQVLQDIFDRLNNYGKRLKRAEIFAALNAADENSEALTLEVIADHIQAEREFGHVDVDTVLKAVLARRGADVQGDVRDEFGENDVEGRDTAYKEGERALARAVAFLQDEVGVPHVGFLANRYLLVVLARVFALHEPDVRNRQLLRRWYWRTALAGPGHFRGGVTGAVRKLCKLVRPDDLSGSVQALLGAVDDITPPALPDLRRFSAQDATTKIVLCSWWAQGPRSPQTGEIYDRGQLARCLEERQTASEAVQNVADPSTMPKQFRSHAANRVLMPTDGGDLAEQLTDSGLPFGADEWRAVLESHAMTTRLVELLAGGSGEQFAVERSELLGRLLNDFLGRMCEWGFENTPPLGELILDVEGDSFDFPDDGPESTPVLGA